ncbi:hypothetical protein DEU56DRAFT_799320, partial [Suillus clintonianus]|uniref:uncharacterized protein n=1 Tax=Suillus clintonianus TaxID=1904413 RepID=UPI001B875BCB
DHPQHPFLSRHHYTTSCWAVFGCGDIFTNRFVYYHPWWWSCNSPCRSTYASAGLPCHEHDAISANFLSHLSSGQYGNVSMGFEQYRVEDPYGLNSRGQQSAWTATMLILHSICSSSKAFAYGHSHIARSNDGCVLQGTSPHSASLTPPHTNATGYTDVAGYANVSPFGTVAVAGSLNDPYQSYGYGM